MLNLLKSEFYNLKHSKLYLTLVLAVVAQSVLCPFIFSRNLTGKEAFLKVLYMQQYLGLIILTGFFAAYCIGRDFESGFIKSKIAFGYKTVDLVLSKAVIILSASVLLNILSPILITFFNSWMNGYGEPFSWNSFSFISTKILLMTAVYTGITSLTLPLVFFIKKTGLSFFAFYGFSMMCNLLSAVAMRVPAIGFIYDNSIMGIGSTAVYSALTLNNIIRIILISVLTIAFSIFLSLFVFKRSELK